MTMTSRMKPRVGGWAVLAVLAIAVLATPSSADYIVTPDVHWSMNDSSPPIDDLVFGVGSPYKGLCNQGISGGCPSQDSGINASQKFDSDTDEVFVEANAQAQAPFDWEIDESFAIELWMKRGGDNITNNEVAIGRDDGVDNNGGLHWWLGINDEGRARFILRGLTTAVFGDVLSDTVVADGEWHHIVAMRNAENDQLTMYVDGVMEPSTGPVTANLAGGFLHNTRPLTIGYFNDHNGDRLHFGKDAANGGSLDEIALYSSLLDAMTIKQHYLNGKAGEGLEESFAPMIATTPLEAGSIGYEYSYDVDASGSPIPVYSLTSGPPNMSMSDTAEGVLSWIPAGSDAGLDHPFTVTATNAISSAAQNATVSIYDVCNGYMDAYWDFNNQADLYGDIIGTNDGDCSGNCPSVVSDPDAVVGDAVQFNGSSTWIDVANDPVGTDVFDWSASDSFSLELWLRRSAAGLTGNEALIGREDAGGNLHWHVGLNASGQVRFRLRDILNVDHQVLSDAIVADGEWHHVVAVRDKDNSQLLLYIDGQLDPAGVTTADDYVGGFSAPLVPLNIGYVGEDGTGANFFGGDVDEVAIYNFVLPEGILAQHYIYSPQINRGYCNAAPVITGPASMNATEDTPFTIAVDNLAVTDPDSTFPDDFTLTIQAGDNYTYAGNTVTPDSDFNGVLQVGIRVNDTYSYSDVYNLTVNVAAEDDAPVVDAIPDQTIQAGASFQTIDLDTYVTDVDTPKDQLVWTTSGNSALTVSISADRKATVASPNANWAGTEAITFRATDPAVNSLYGEATANFTVGASTDNGGGGGGGGGCFISAIGSNN